MRSSRSLARSMSSAVATGVPSSRYRAMMKSRSSSSASSTSSSSSASSSSSRSSSTRSGSASTRSGSASSRPGRSSPRSPRSYSSSLLSAIRRPPFTSPHRITSSRGAHQWGHAPMPTRYPLYANVQSVELRVISHPLVSHKLTLLRDRRTDSPSFRRLVEELVMLLAYEATDQIRVEPAEIETPIQKMTGVRLSRPHPLVVPILRAGLGMLAVSYT